MIEPSAGDRGPNELKGLFTAIPGVGFPAYLSQVVRLDFGPDSVRGVSNDLAAGEGKPYPHFVPAVDRDGNEVTGIRLPDLTVPATERRAWRHAVYEVIQTMTSSLPQGQVTKSARACEGVGLRWAAYRPAAGHGLLL